MSKLDDGGPAFPRPEVLNPLTGQPWDEGFQGMPMLDVFAGLAMCGLASSEGWGENMAEAISRTAYNIAEAMLAEREKRRAGA